jgi:Mrp family chromosome partitioning ATPase
MINVKKSTLFFEQLKGKRDPTVQDLLNAARATGNIAEITDVILSYAKGMGIDVTSELNELTQNREKAMQDKAVQETVESLAEKSGALVTETDKAKRRELIKECEDTIKQLNDITALSPGKNIGTPFNELLQTQFPPDTWFVENLIGPGLTVLTGASKVGKSWIALQLATALDQGGYFL